MSVTSGFFNSLSGDRKYDAIQISSMFDGLITDGIYNGFLESFMVTASDPASMVVTVGEGRCWFNHTWTLNDAPLPLTLDVGDVVLNRIDTVVIDVDSTDTVRACTIKVVKGTPSSQAVAPTLENTETHHQYPLCDISVVAGATTVTQSNITNRRGTSDCPFVATLMKSVNVDDLLIQWESQWNDWMTDRANSMDSWTAEQQEAFTTWFQTVQDTLDEDTAGNLYNLITNNTGINATATHAEGVVAITATGNPVNIVFLAPSDWAETDTYTYNGSPVELVDLLGEPVEDAWIQGSPVSLTITGGKAFFKNGGGRYKPTDLPPLNPNFTMEISEGDSEDTVTVTADKLTISPTTDMLAGGQWEYGTEMSPAPGKGQNIKHWTREQLVTSGKPFDGLLLGDVTASDAANETILWLPENQNGETVLVPFIVLSVDYLGGCLVLRKNSWTSSNFNGDFEGSNVDTILKSTYSNSVLSESVFSSVLTVSLPCWESENHSYNTKIFILSMAELNFGTGGDIPVEGTAMPYFNTADRRKTSIDGQNSVSDYWSRTNSTTSTSKYFVDTSGQKSSTSSDVSKAVRPAFVLPKDFQIQQRPDGSYTVYNDCGLITLKDIEASTSSTKIVINLLENSGNASYLYLSKNYNDSDRGLIQRENIPFERACSSTEYTSGLSNAIIQWCQTNINNSVQNLVEDVSFKYMKSTHVSGSKYSFSPVDFTAKYFALSVSEMGGNDVGTGTVIPYFENNNLNRVKTYNGTARPYFTRDISAQYAPNSANFYVVSVSGSIVKGEYEKARGNVPAFTLPLTAPIRLLADGTYDLVPEDPSLSAQTVSTLAEEQSGTTVQLNQIPEGSVLKIKENGQDVDFYVAKQDYESDLNSDGRTLVVRKDCYDNRVWDSGNVNAYATSDLDSWFNSTYKALLDESIQEAIGTTKIRYTPGNGNNTVGTLERAIFALSLTELGQSYSYANMEGSALPIASTLRIAYRNGSPTTQWTRSPYTNNTNSAWRLYSDGDFSGSRCGNSYGSRPAFTLPGDSYATANDDGTYTFTGEDTSSPVVSFSFTVPHGTQPVVRQYTYNYEEHYQTMLEGGVLPALGGDTGPTYSEVLSENTWAQIAQAVADKDPILDVWQVGDTKDEVIAGETLTFAIMGKNMDDLADGSGKAGLTFGMTQLMASTRQMNSSNTNAGSFAGSAMYSWLSGTIYPNLPAELKDAIKAVNKKTSSGGGSSVIRTDPMYLWLFAEIEVFGKTTYSYAGEGTQYPYFATAAERIKRLSNGAGAASYWWERSPDTYGSGNFCGVTTSGAASYSGADDSRGVCFGFCI